MHIGVIIGRIGGSDGVALEAGKWIEVLTSMGHRVFTLSGEFQERRMDPASETCQPELSYQSQDNFWSQKRAFFYPDTTPEELIDHLRYHADLLHRKILDWISRNKLKMVISENLSSLPGHLVAGLAIRMAARTSGIPVITHDHQFSWEKGDRFHSRHREIDEYLSGIFPLRLDNSYHAVLSSHARHELQERYGRDSVVVPNVMDFDRPFGLKDKNNAKLLEELGFGSDDLLLFQVTWILRRKGIHTAIQLVEALNDPRVKLVVTGTYPDDAGSAYREELEQQVRDAGLTGRVRFAHHLFHHGPSGREVPPVFSLSDAYARATACTYFSTYESFGNAFLEAVLARRPVFVNNYKPVFQEDIASKGFRVVAIENNQLTGEAVRAMAEILNDPSLAEEMARYNFETGRRYFSYDTLRDKLAELMAMAF